MLLSLQKLTLAAPLNQTGECLILTELILPRNGIAKKSALKELRLTKGKRSLSRSPFYESGLFKEKVDGPFGIKVSVTRPLKHPELNKLFRQLLTTGVEGLGEAAALSAFPSLSVSAFTRGLRELVKIPFDEASEAFKSNQSAFIATGGIDLDSEALVAGAVTIDLNLEEALRIPDLPPGPKSRDRRKTAAKRYEKGIVVGTIIFDLGV